MCGETYRQMERDHCNAIRKTGFQHGVDSGQMAGRDGANQSKGVSHGRRSIRNEGGAGEGAYCEQAFTLGRHNVWAFYCYSKTRYEIHGMVQAQAASVSRSREEWRGSETNVKGAVGEDEVV